MLRVALGFLVLCVLVSAFNFARAADGVCSEVSTLGDERQPIHSKRIEVTEAPSTLTPDSATVNPGNPD